MKAQNDTIGEKKMCNGYMRAAYIFEGKMDSSKYFTIKTGEYTYVNFMSYLVEVDKVIKGNIQKGTIEILQPADGIIYKGPEGTRSSITKDGPGGVISKGVYFCWGKAKDMTSSNYTNSNGKTLRDFGGMPVTNGKINKDPRGGISLYFSTLSDFYNYISANYGVTIK